jgi:hypothetical protein
MLSKCPLPILQFVPFHLCVPAGLENAQSFEVCMLQLIIYGFLCYVARMFSPFQMLGWRAAF